MAERFRSTASTTTYRPMAIPQVNQEKQTQQKKRSGDRKQHELRRICKCFDVMLVLKMRVMYKWFICFWIYWKIIEKDRSKLKKFKFENSINYISKLSYFILFWIKNCSPWSKFFSIFLLHYFYLFILFFNAKKSYENWSDITSNRICLLRTRQYKSYCWNV